MSKKLAVALLAILVSAGAANARVIGTANPHKYLHRCTDGRVGASCACHAGASHHYQVCRVGEYCHTFEGVCRQ
jgi:hypothetical protein